MRKIISLCIVIFGVNLANAAEIAHTIHFAPQKTSKIIEGAVVLGDRDIYFITARAQQQMSISISSLEDNAVFSIVSPTGVELKNASEEDDATNWSGKLPTSGRYKIIVGGTRGNATYKLITKIK